MNYDNNSSAIALSDTKKAALFFDYVIPFDIKEVLRHEKSDDIEYHKVLQEILPQELIDPNSKNKISLSSEITNYVAHYLCTFPNIIGVKELSKGESFNDRFENSFPKMLDAFSDVLKKVKIKPHNIFGNLPESAYIKTEKLSPNIILSNLDIINCSSLTWRKLFEFKKDLNSLKKIRNLRLFIFQNYQDKDISFIKDDINKKIDEYQSVVKKWGFETVLSTLKTTLSSRTLLTAGGTLALKLMGMPIDIAITSGGIIEVGNILISFAERKIELKKFKQENPITYLIEAQQLIKK